MKIKAQIKPNTISPLNQYTIELNIQNDANISCHVIEIVVTIPDFKFNYKACVNWNFEPKFIGLIPTSKSYSIPISPFRNILNGKKLGRHQILIKAKIQEGSQFYHSKPRWIKFDPSYSQVSPGREFKAFVSRSIRTMESVIPNRITKMLKKWGFNPVTIGIPPNDKKTDFNASIAQEIGNSDVVFIIATKREKLLKPFGWTISEWLQSEAGIAYAQKKIVFVFKQFGAMVSGQVGEYPSVTFSRWNLRGLEKYIDENMIEIRNAIIQDKNSINLKTGLKGAAIGVILGGFGKLIYELGRKRGKSEN